MSDESPQESSETGTDVVPAGDGTSGQDNAGEASAAPEQEAHNPYSMLLAILGGGVALAIVIFAIGLVANSGDDEGGGGGAESTPGNAAPVVLSEFAIDGNLVVPPGASLDVVNEGSQVHNLYIEGDGNTADLAGGESEVLSLEGLDTGDYVVYCNIAGHREAGMETSMTIEEGAEISSEDPHAGANPDYAQLDTDMLDSFQPFVDQLTSGERNTEGQGAQPMEPVIDPDGYKRFDLVAEIGEWEIEPGNVVEAWTFNGTVPGPTIRVNVGDKVRIRLINRLPLGTDIHLHGIRKDNEFDGVAPLTQDLTMQGDTFDYEFTAIEPAVGMYHPHAHGYLAIPNGMWGALLVQTDDLLPRGETVSGVTIPQDLTLAREDVMVLNDAGTIGLSLNGKSFPGTEGYEFNVGDWAAFHYYNEGLQIHPMHLHQFPQLVYAKDGIPLDQPYWADTVNVAPGERYSVLFQAARTGVWVWHCHILNHAEREDGMFGMVTALVVS